MLQPCPCPCLCSKLATHCRWAQVKECKKHTQPVPKISLAVETKRHMLKQQEQKDELKAKVVESRRARRCTGKTPGHLASCSTIPPYGALVDNAWPLPLPAAPRRCPFHFTFWYPAPEVATAYRPLPLSHIAFWPPSSPPVFALQSFLGPCCVSGLLSPLCRWNQCRCQQQPSGQRDQVLYTCHCPSTEHGRQAPVPLSLTHKTQRLPASLVLHTGSAGTRLGL